MKYDVCIICKAVFDCNRTLPTSIQLKLNHPEININKCSMCNFRSDDVMYQISDHFCKRCLKFRDKKRYMCSLCYNMHRNRHIPCFYCLDTIDINPDKSQYKCT